jgi:hypothetical protein
MQDTAGVCGGCRHHDALNPTRSAMARVPHTALPRFTDIRWRHLDRHQPIPDPAVVLEQGALPADLCRRPHLV